MTSPANPFARTILPILALAPLLVFVATPSAAQQNDGWDHRLTLYGLGAAQDGAVTVRGRTAEVDLSFSDILDDLELGAMAHYRATRGQWGFALDGIFMNLVSEGERGLVQTDFEQWAIEGTGIYRLGDSTEALFGVRYNRLRGRLDLQGPLRQRFRQSQDWYDPFVGVGWNPRLSDSWHARLRGDVGGFGVGSDFTWQLAAYLDWRASDLISVIFGYRALDIDYEDGRGNELFRYDVLTQGPAVGVSFHF